jgi:hypothetical protein
MVECEVNAIKPCLNHAVIQLVGHQEKGILEQIFGTIKSLPVRLCNWAAEAIKKEKTLNS